jgi:ribosomal protein S18 acetylase RimI-like enzyme
MTGGKPLLIDDSFAGEYLRRSVLRLAQADRATEALKAIPADLRGAVMIEARVPVEAVATLRSLASLGFSVIDTNVQLGASRADLLGASIVNGAAWRVRDARPGDRAEVMRIARDNLVASRFHLDPRIEPTHASELKGAWAGNFFEGLRGERLCVAEADSGVAGFLLALERNGQGIIDLIAVDPVLRGTGAAAGLIHAWLTGSPGLSAIQVGTQVANVRSLRFYERIGFRVLGAAYVLHCHGDASELRKLAA